jgi:2-polyprenyl-3-methyl-5-hydroxy-6-metoxy-1,4-benzoquinol methylase
MAETTIQYDPTDVIDGGERVIHLWPNDCYLAHLSIYHFAAPFSKNGIVLDAGSGTGYGSAYLADHGARFVHGIDIGEKAVGFSRLNFNKPNLQFQVMDLERITGFAERSFDFIFSSNALEHVQCVPAFFQAAWRLLKPEGRILIAVPPITTADARKADLANKYHLNSWSPRQWHFVLGQYFKEISCYTHYFDKPGVSLNFANHPKEVVITEADFTFTPVSLEAMYKKPTFSAIFVASYPKPQTSIPRPGRPTKFIDDSFTRRPGEGPPPPWYRSALLAPLRRALPAPLKKQIKRLFLEG